MKFERFDRNSDVSERQTEKSVENITDKEFFRARNEIQIKFAARYYGFEIENEQLEKWIIEYSEKFGENISKHPELIEEYIKGETEKVVDELAELLYKNHEVHA